MIFLDIHSEPLLHIFQRYLSYYGATLVSYKCMNMLWALGEVSSSAGNTEHMVEDADSLSWPLLRVVVEIILSREKTA